MINQNYTPSNEVWPDNTGLDWHGPSGNCFDDIPPLETNAIPESPLRSPLRHNHSPINPHLLTFSFQQDGESGGAGPNFVALYFVDCKTPLFPLIGGV